LKVSLLKNHIKSCWERINRYPYLLIEQARWYHEKITPKLIENYWKAILFNPFKKIPRKYLATYWKSFATLIRVVVAYLFLRVLDGAIDLHFTPYINLWSAFYWQMHWISPTLFVVLICSSKITTIKKTRACLYFKREWVCGGLMICGEFLIISSLTEYEQHYFKRRQTNDGYVGDTN